MSNRPRLLQWGVVVKDAERLLDAKGTGGSVLKLATKAPNFSDLPVFVGDAGPANIGRTAMVSIAGGLAGVILFLAASGFFAKSAAATLTFVSVLFAAKTLLTPKVTKKFAGPDVIVESQRWPFKPNTVSKEPLSNFSGVQLSLFPVLDDEYPYVIDALNQITSQDRTAAPKTGENLPAGE